MTTEMKFSLKHLGHSGSKMADNIKMPKLWAVSKLWQKASRWFADTYEHFKWCFSLLSYKQQSTSKKSDKEFKTCRIFFFMTIVNYIICIANFVISPSKLDTIILMPLSFIVLTFSMWLQFINMVRAKLTHCTNEVLKAGGCLQKEYPEVALIFAVNGRELLVSEAVYNRWMAQFKDYVAKSEEARGRRVFSIEYIMRSNLAFAKATLCSDELADVVAAKYDFEFNGIFAKPRAMREFAKRGLRLP